MARSRALDKRLKSVRRPVADLAVKVQIDRLLYPAICTCKCRLRARYLFCDDLKEHRSVRERIAADVTRRRIPTIVIDVRQSESDGVFAYVLRVLRVRQNTIAPVRNRVRREGRARICFGLQDIAPRIAQRRLDLLFADDKLRRLCTC